MYVPAVGTVIEAVVAPVDHNKLVPVALKTELPQLLVTVTTGADGTANGAAIPDPAALVQPPTVCVTVYVPVVVTVIEAVVAPVDQSKLDPVAVKTEFPQLLVTVTAGAEGIAKGAAIPDPAGLVQPATVCVTVYVPAVVTVIDEVVAPVDHNQLDPVAVRTEFPQLFVTDTTGADGAALIVSTKELAVELPHEFVATAAIVPEVEPPVTVIEVVPCPAVIEDPAGTVQT